MPLPLIGGLMAGLEAFLARFAVGVGLRAAAGQAAKTVGKKAFSEFVEAKVAPKVVNVFRGVKAADLPSEFAAPTARKAPPVIYESSRAAAEKTAGEGGRVFEMRLPRARISDYSPSPIQGGGMKYTVPYAEHYESARRAAMTRSMLDTPLGRVARAMFGPPPSPAQQPAAQGHPNVVAPNQATPPASQRGSPTTTIQVPQPTSSLSQRAASWKSYFVRQWMAGGGSGQPNYPPGRSWSSTVRNFFSNVAGGNTWRPSGSGGSGSSGGSGGGSGSPPPSGGGTSSYPNINPSALVAMMGRTQPQIAAANAAAAAAQAQVQQQRNQQKLANTTLKLSGAFSGLLSLATKAGAAGVAYTSMAGAAIDSKISGRAGYHPEFAAMKIQREYQDISLTRRLANETAPSAQRLNAAQMEGKEQLNAMWSKLEPALNNLMTLGQSGVNKLLVIADKVLMLDQIASINRTLEKLLGVEEKKDKDELANFAHNLIDIARRNQVQNRHMKQKKPLEGVR